MARPAPGTLRSCAYKELGHSPRYLHSSPQVLPARRLPGPAVYPVGTGCLGDRAGGVSVGEVGALCVPRDCSPPAVSAAPRPSYGACLLWTGSLTTLNHLHGVRRLCAHSSGRGSSSGEGTSRFTAWNFSSQPSLPLCPVCIQKQTPGTTCHFVRKYFGVDLYENRPFEKKRKGRHAATVTPSSSAVTL